MPREGCAASREILGRKVGKPSKCPNTSLGEDAYTYSEPSSHQIRKKRRDKGGEKVDK
jgi:hypothetical protein